MISERITFRRNVEDISIDELSSISGISCEKIEAFEADTDTPNSTELLQLAHTLGVNVVYFFRDSLSMEIKCVRTNE